MSIAPHVSHLSTPSGAECKLNEHIALRWSAVTLKVSGYKHRAPLEHYAAQPFK
jgi:hypothetical protein